MHVRTLVPLLAIATHAHSAPTPPPHGMRVTATPANSATPASTCMTTIAALRALTPSAHPCVLVLGYHAAGDRGGGHFYWDASSAAPDNGGTVIAPSGNPASGRWRRLVDDSLSVRWFGAVGDGVADDTRAIQAAIDALSAGPGVGAGVVRFPLGHYRITGSLRVVDNAQHGNAGRIQLVGAHGSASGAHRCTIQWNTRVSEAPMLLLHSTDCVVRNLAFQAVRGSKTAAAIDIDNPTGPGANRCSNNVFEHVQIRGLGGGMVDGVRLARTARGNVEYMRFVKCYFMDIRHACVHIPSRTLQSKHHTFEDCSFQRARFGIKTATGSFQTRSCGFGALDTAIQLGSPTDNIAIADSDVERCRRFLSTRPGNTAGPWAVSILGGRFGVSDLAADGRFIDFTMGGPLVIQNAHFGPAPAPAFRVFAGSGFPGACLVSIGNSFPNTTPYDANGRHRRVSLGNRGRDRNGAPRNLDDEISGQHGAGGRLLLATVAALSGTARHAHNLRGSTAIGGTSSSTQVTFAAPEPDADYRVLATAVETTPGTPGAATRVRVSGRSTTGFSLSVEQAPGAGRTVSIDWLVVR